MAKIQFTPEAISDLQSTRRYIEEELCSEQAAQNTIRKIMSRIAQLETFPEIGALLNSIVPVANDYRFLVCGNYTAFYRYENGEVFIIRVLYGRRNFMQLLFGEPEEDSNNRISANKIIVKHNGAFFCWLKGNKP